MFYVISYDLTNSIPNPRLRSWLEKSAAIAIQESVWVCDLRATDSSQLLNELTAIADSNDSFFIAAVQDHEWAATSDVYIKIEGF